MSDSPAAGNPASGIPEEAVKAAGSIIYADIHALLDAGADRIECNPIGRRVLEAALPRLLAEVSAHRAEQDTTLSRVRSLLDAAIFISGERYVRADYIREALEGDSGE